MRKKRSRDRGDIFLDTFKWVFLIIIGIVTIYPFWNIFVVSLNDATDAIRGGIYLWPNNSLRDNT